MLNRFLILVPMSHGFRGLVATKPQTKRTAVARDPSVTASQRSGGTGPEDGARAPVRDLPPKIPMPDRGRVVDRGIAVVIVAPERDMLISVAMGLPDARRLARIKFELAVVTAIGTAAMTAACCDADSIGVVIIQDHRPVVQYLFGRHPEDCGQSLAGGLAGVKAGG